MKWCPSRAQVASDGISFQRKSDAPRIANCGIANHRGGTSKKLAGEDLVEAQKAVQQTEALRDPESGVSGGASQMLFNLATPGRCLASFGIRRETKEEGCLKRFWRQQAESGASPHAHGSCSTTGPLAPSWRPCHSDRFLVEVVLFLEPDLIKDFDAMYIGSDKRQKLNCSEGQ
eukprot:s4920_g7.t1